jgi:chromosome partitioning protein
MSQSLKQTGMRVVTVANRKGGVGKTSSVIQIASGLARRGERVLVIDGDPQGNLTLFFGGKEKKDFASMLESMSRDEKIKADEYVNRGVRRHLDILPAKNRNLRLEIHDTEISRAFDPFTLFIDSLRNSYEWILIDSSPSNSPLERLLIRASDAVIIPLEFQLFSVSGLESILEEVTFCADDSKRDIKVHSLIFTKAENRLNRVNTYRQLFSSFHIPIFEICKSEYVTRSIEKSRTIWECGPSSYAARDYARIIDKGFLETL